MPFKSKSQMRACYVADDPKWDCHKWAHKTENMKALPDRLGEGKKEDHKEKLRQELLRR